MAKETRAAQTWNTVEYCFLSSQWTQPSPWQIWAWEYLRSDGDAHTAFQHPISKTVMNHTVSLRSL